MVSRFKEGEKKEPKVLSEDQFLAQNGAGFMEGAEPALHRTPGWKEGDKKRSKAAKKVLQDMTENDEKRKGLRKEYADKVAAGDIRPPSDVESLIHTAQGDEHMSSVQAARRVLAKRGINWETGGELNSEKSSEPRAMWTKTENYSRGDIDPITGGRDVYHDIKVTHGGKSYTYPVRMMRAGSTSMSEDKASAKKLALEMHKQAMEKPPVEVGGNDEIPLVFRTAEELKDSLLDKDKLYRGIELYGVNRVTRHINLAKDRGIEQGKINQIKDTASIYGATWYKRESDKLAQKIPDEMERYDQVRALHKKAQKVAEDKAIELLTAEQAPEPETGDIEAHLITGNTYTHKSNIKGQFQGKWNSDMGGWIVHNKFGQGATKYANEHGLDIEPVTVDASVFKKLTGEELRAARQERADKKADQLRSRADKKMKTAEEHQRRGDAINKQWEFGQPILVGHHSEKKSRRDHEKAWNQLEKFAENYKESQELSDRADRVQSSVSVKGDAEKRRQARREQIKANLKIGTKVLTPDAMGEGEIRKINNKSVQIYYPKFDTTHTTDISFVRIVG
jgi:hypothetical protein